VSGGGGKITIVSGEGDIADSLLQAQIRPVSIRNAYRSKPMSRFIQSGQLLIMTSETKLTVDIGHFEEVHDAKPVMYVMT
jgi:hypothetical protein